MTTRVLLADDHRMFREGIRAVLQDEPDLEVVGEAADGRAACEMAGRLGPHVVLMDISMPQLNGIDATRQLAAEHPEIRVIGVSSHADPRYVAHMLAAGAAGYLVKSSIGEQLVRAIRAVCRNQRYVSTEIAARS
jgi:two-component system, NarL family, response regulator NreC